MLLYSYFYFSFSLDLRTVVATSLREGPSPPSQALPTSNEVSAESSLSMKKNGWIVTTRMLQRAEGRAVLLLVHTAIGRTKDSQPWSACRLASSIAPPSPTLPSPDVMLPLFPLLPLPLILPHTPATAQYSPPSTTRYFRRFDLIDSSKKNGQRRIYSGS